MTARTAFAALFLAAIPTGAQDWPQWRGPNRDGVVAGLAPRAAWPASLKPGWKATVGRGHASPIVAQGRVYTFGRQGDDEVVSAFDLGSGKLVWKQGHPTPYTMNMAAASHGKGPKSTPVVSGGRLYTLGLSGVLSCLDAATGRVVWRKDFAGQHRATFPLYGAAMSPVVEGGLVIAHVGGPDDGALTAFDAATGEPRWVWKGDGPGYSSPVVGTFGGARQVVTQTQKSLVGVSLEKGQLLWSVPFNTDYDQNSVTPVLLGDLVIYSGLDRGLHAVRPVKTGASWRAEPAWNNDEVSSYLSSPVLQGDRLFGLSHRQKGQFFALDARSGKTLWKSDGRQGENAAVLAAGPVLFLLTTDARLLVASASAPTFQVLATYTVAESPTWAHPVVVAGGFLVKDAEGLTLWRFD
jgi:outer membrane protein assembly factor BamB